MNNMKTVTSDSMGITLSVYGGDAGAKTRLYYYKEVAQKFNNWKNDKDAQEWLKIMMYNLDEIQSVESVANSLKLFCGELPPRVGSRDSKRMYINELSENEQTELKNFLSKNFVMIISDIIRGRGRFAAEWMLVIHKYNGYKWKLVSINEAINHYVGDHQVEFTTQGGIRMGRITVQRKGGDNGAETANQLQFKANPLSIFEIEE